MSINAIPIAFGEHDGADSGLSKAELMSARRRDFAREFVLNGGNGTKAAVVAGYSDANPQKAAMRCLLDPKVLSEIKRHMIVNVSAYLPIAIRTLVEIMCDPETPARDRISAANSLLDRAGMAAPKGGVQVNVGVQVNGNEVQSLIGSVWDARNSRLSGIGASMSDTQPAIEQAEQPALAAPNEPMGWGGVASSGSPGFPSNIPPPPAEPHQFPQAEGTNDASDPGYATLSDGTRADGRPSWPTGADMAGCHRAVAVTAERATDAGGGSGAELHRDAGPSEAGDAWGRAAASAGGVFDGAGRSQRQPLDYD